MKARKLSAKMLRRCMSLVLALAMLLAWLPAAGLVSAAEGDVNIRIHYYSEPEWGWTPAIQFWGGENTVPSDYESGPTEIPGWGGAQGYTLRNDGDGWFSIVLTGDFTGFQFLSITDPSGNTAGKGYDSLMAQFTDAEPKDLYCRYNESTGYNTKWYLDQACTQELRAEGEVQTYEFLVHYANPGNWTTVNVYGWAGSDNPFGNWPGTAATANADNAGWYDATMVVEADNPGIIFNNGSGTQTADLILAAAGDFTEAWVSGNSSSDISYEAPEGWVVDKNKTVTVHFLPLDGWGETINAYVWNGGNAVPGYEDYHSWPGKALSANAEHIGWYDLIVETELDIGFNFIFNDGSNQTSDLATGALRGDLELWYIGGDKYTVAPGEWTGDMTYTVTVHFTNPNHWEAVNAYAWDEGGELNGAWPGAAVEKGESYYDLTLSTKNANGFNFIFSNGAEQTGDLSTGALTARNTELWCDGVNVLTAPPAKAGVNNNPNGTTTFALQGENGMSVVLYYGDKAAVEAGAELSKLELPEIAGGQSVSEDIFFGDAAVDLVYYYEIGGVHTLDTTAETVTLGDVVYSRYVRDEFKGRIVNVAGTFPGPSWDATSNVMTYMGNGRYEYTFKDVPAAKYEYKIAFNSWDPENYGLNGVSYGPNIPVAVAQKQDVTIYYNDFTHYSVNSIDYVFADITLSGTGVPEDTKLTDEGLSGIYSVTLDLTAGTYTDLVLSFNGQAYPIAEFVLSEDKAVTFFFDPSTGIYYHNGSDAKVEAEYVYYNTQDVDYKSVFGAVAQNEEVTFTMTTGKDVVQAKLVVKGVGTYDLEETPLVTEQTKRWSCIVSFESMGEFEYYFALSNGSDVKIYGDDDGYYGEGVLTELTAVQPYDLIVYQAGFETPDWMKNGVIYQIFPDRFFDGDSANNLAQTTARGDVDYEYVPGWYTLPENPQQEEWLDQETYMSTGAWWGDGEWSNEIYGGDLKGIVEKIDYLKALGVNVIYLNPVFASISNHRYDACDYTEIDPILGTLGDFEELVAIAEANDMHIILDGVFNHVSDDSVYFDRYYKYLGKSEKIGAYPYWAYVYDMMNEQGTSQETAEAAAREYFSAEYGITDYSYVEWFGVNNSPLLDENNVAVTDDIGLRAGKDVYGYEGWWGYDSMPVILSTNGSEYQTGNWAEEIIYNEEGTSVSQYWISKGNNGWRLDVANEVSDETWQNFRASVKAMDSEAVIVGEIWDDATKYLMGDMYDSVMNYLFRNAVTGYAMGTLDAEGATRDLERIRERYPEEAFYAMMNLVGSHDTSRLLSYLDGIGDDRSDTSIEAAFPTYENTSDTAKAQQYLVAFLQFTYPGAPTIYYGDEIGMVGADDPDDRRAFQWGKGNQQLVEWYATLAAIREAYPALRTGDIEMGSAYEANEHILCYLRTLEDSEVYVFANNSENAVVSYYDGSESKLINVLTGEEWDGTIPAYSGVILVEEDDYVAVEVNYKDLAPAYDPAYIVEEREITHTHAYTTEVVAPTCITEGYTLYTCSCGDSYKDDYTAAGEHSWGEWTLTKDGSCFVSGEEERVCALCGEIENRSTAVNPDNCLAKDYTDLDPDQWYHEAVEYALAEGLMNGMGNDQFEPNSAMTRAMLVTVLWRSAGSPEAENSAFTDVPADEWYTKAVAWAAANGIVNGTSETTFSPEDNITREQMAAILYRYAGKLGLDTSKRADFSSFPDADKTSNYAKDAISWAVAEGILQGSKEGDVVYLAPLGDATRAQVATLLMRFLEETVK